MNNLKRPLFDSDPMKLKNNIDSWKEHLQTIGDRLTALKSRALGVGLSIA